MNALEVPLFVPTSFGRVFGIATLPQGTAVLRDPGVLLLPGGRAGAGVLPLFQTIARRLAERGQPVFRFDYPGGGLSAGEDPVPRSELPHLVHELCDWFARETGAAEFALAGRCSGGRVTLAMPRLDERVKVCVAAVPFLDLGGWSLRSKLADLDARGPRLARRLIPAPRAERTSEPSRTRKELEAECIADLLAAAERTRTTVVFGEHDGLRPRFDALAAQAGVADRIDMVILPEARLHGLPNVDHERVLGDVLERRLETGEVARG